MRYLKYSRCCSTTARMYPPLKVCFLVVVAVAVGALCSFIAMCTVSVDLQKVDSLGIYSGQNKSDIVGYLLSEETLENSSQSQTPIPIVASSLTRHDPHREKGENDTVGAGLTVDVLQDATQQEEMRKEHFFVPQNTDDQGEIRNHLNHQHETRTHDKPRLRMSDNQKRPRLQYDNAKQIQKKGPDSDSEGMYTQTIAASSPIRNCSLQNAKAGKFSASDCNRGGYFLSLSYTDQATNAINRMGSLQCLAGRMEMSVVEPFIHTNNHLSNWPPPRDIATPLRFRDVFNVTDWIAKGQQYSFSPLVMWEDFLQTAPRNVILVEIRYSPEKWNHWDNSVGSCSLNEPNQFFSQQLQQYHFRVHDEVCLNFRKYGALTTERFRSIVFEKFSPHNSTVVINEWRGISENITYYVQMNDTGCNDGEFLHFLEPSWTVLQDASTYIRRYLNDNFNYIALMVRWERILKNSPYHGLRCMNIIKNYLARIHAKTGLTSVFLTVDVGKYGSYAYIAHPKPRHLLAYNNTEALLHLLYGETMTLSHYEERFQTISQVDRRAYVAVVQKEIAARAKCLFLVGTGVYQQHALYTWQSYHHGETCIESVHEC